MDHTDRLKLGASARAGVAQPWPRPESGRVGCENSLKDRGGAGEDRAFGLKLKAPVRKLGWGGVGRGGGAVGLGGTEHEADRTRRIRLMFSRYPKRKEIKHNFSEDAATFKYTPLTRCTN